MSEAHTNATEVVGGLLHLNSVVLLWSVAYMGLDRVRERFERSPHLDEITNAAEELKGSLSLIDHERPPPLMPSDHDRALWRRIKELWHFKFYKFNARNKALLLMWFLGNLRHTGYLHGFVFAARRLWHLPMWGLLFKKQRDIYFHTISFILSSLIFLGLLCYMTFSFDVRILNIKLDIIKILQKTYFFLSIILALQVIISICLVRSLSFRRNIDRFIANIRAEGEYIDLGPLEAYTKKRVDPKIQIQQKVMHISENMFIHTILFPSYIVFIYQTYQISFIKLALFSPKSSLHEFFMIIIESLK